MCCKEGEGEREREGGENKRSVFNFCLLTNKFLLTFQDTPILIFCLEQKEIWIEVRQGVRLSLFQLLSAPSDTLIISFFFFSLKFSSYLLRADFGHFWVEGVAVG